MDKSEDFIINEPYQVTTADEDAFQTASPDAKNSRQWENNCLSEFKERFRDDMLPKQNNVCAYCRLELHPNEVTPEIEHIVPKSEKPDWMYDPFNLCLSCTNCNRKKNTKEVLRNNRVTELPRNSDDYLLIHPHLDKYSDYIEFVGNVLYKAKGDNNSKGAKTIEICELNRIEVAIARAMQYINRHGTGKHFVDFLLLMNSPMNKRLIKDEDAERFNKKLKERINIYLMIQKTQT
jgi:uncharacterized protein (TIGR02646 family)